MHVLPLAVLDDLDFKGLFVGKLKDARRHLFNGCELCCPETAGTCNDLKAFTLGANGDGLNETMNADALCKLGQLDWLEGTAGIGGGLVQQRERNGAVF